MEILALNPSRPHRGRKRRKARKASPAKKEAPKMARRRRRGGAGHGRRRSTKRAIVRWNPGEELALLNPARPPSRWRRARRAAGGFAAATGLGSAFHSLFPMAIGAIGSKIAQKKFGSGKDESQPWEMKDYFVALLGGLAISWGSKAIGRTAPGTSQKILEGSLLFMAMELITKQLAPMTETTKNWLGEEQQGAVPSDEGSWAGLNVGDLYEAGDGTTYVLGEDGYWRRADNMHRLGPVMGDSVHPVGPALGQADPWAGIGDSVHPVGPALGENPDHPRGSHRW